MPLDAISTPMVITPKNTNIINHFDLLFATTDQVEPKGNDNVEFACIIQPTDGRRIVLPMTRKQLFNFAGSAMGILAETGLSNLGDS